MNSAKRGSIFSSLYKTENQCKSVLSFRIQLILGRVSSLLSSVHGGRSRLHLIDLASCEGYTGSKNNGGASSMSLSGLGNVIISLINGAKHVPHRYVEPITFEKAVQSRLGSRDRCQLHIRSASNVQLLILLSFEHIWECFSLSPFALLFELMLKMKLSHFCCSQSSYRLIFYASKVLNSPATSNILF